jgi:hypothetical protein
MKRPDVSLRNKLNNPMADPNTRKKMRLSLTGKKQSADTKAKRSAALKKYYQDHPEAADKLAKNIWDKYTSKISGTGWRKVRIKALERDGYKCTICGEDSYRRLVVHHIDWRGKGLKAADMNNDLDNLQTLCHKCHNGIHRHKSSDYKDRKRAMP